MCFSAEADIAGGVVAGLIGVDALRHTELKSELPLASLPLLFAAHQFTEVFVWWGLDDRVPWSVGSSAVWLYLLFAFVLLPVFLPLAVRAIEPDADRRRLMGVCAALGTGVAATYLIVLMVTPVTAEIDGHRLVYLTDLNGLWIVNGFYVVAGCAALVLSSHRHIVAFGVANLAAVALLLSVGSNAKTSLWCAWAALTSVAIAAHLRLAHQPDARRSRLPGHPA